MGKRAGRRTMSPTRTILPNPKNTKRKKGKALPWRAGRGQRWRFPMLTMLRVGPVPAQGAALAPTGTPWPRAKHPKQK
ncbi:hypothetical protein SXCC_00047 [Gluconacetobacter sp. SXCC-1]|nr:hypothetical protein SXCC_00047 [Gluconacetobacter sp. SXCC-1]